MLVGKLLSYEMKMSRETNKPLFYLNIHRTNVALDV